MFLKVTFPLIDSTFAYHIESVPDRSKENLPIQSTVNKVHPMYPGAENLKNHNQETTHSLHHTKPTQNTLVLSLIFH